MQEICALENDFSHPSHKQKNRSPMAHFPILAIQNSSTMPRPKTKEQLLDLSEKHYQKLITYVASFPDAEQQAEFPEGTMNRNIRDVLAHLHHWHLMMLEWYRIGMGGEKPDMPAKGFTWKDTQALNRKIWEQYRSVELGKVQQLLEESHVRIRKLMEQHSDEELFEKRRYKWTGSTSLGAYLISASSSHYDWGYKLIRKCMKARVKA